MPEPQKNLGFTHQTGKDRLAEKSSGLSKAVFFLICAIPVFSTVAYGAVDFWALGFLSVFAGLIAILWLSDAWIAKEFRFTSNRLQIPLFGLIGIGLVQILPLRSAIIPSGLLTEQVVSTLSIAPYSTRFAIVQLIVYFVFFAAALTFINSLNRLRKVVLTIIIAGSVMAFYGILQHLANLESIYGMRPFGQAIPFASFVNRHHFAAFMEMTVGITLALFFGRATRNNKRIFLIIAILIMGMAMMFTGSRGGMIGLLAVVGFIVAANVLRKTDSNSASIDGREKFRRNFAIIGGGIALILILFGSVVLLGGDQALIRGVGLGNEADLSNGRTHFWQVALQIFGDYPIFGAGLDAFGTAFTHYDTWNGMYRIEQAHNDYLQILADGGILGFACAASFIFLLYKGGLRTINESTDSFRRSAATGALAGCCGILIHSFFDFPLRTPSNALFFLILAAIATASIHQPKKIRKRKSSRTAESSSYESDAEV